jgi:outer membrane lipoprotein SlyB
MRLNTVAKAMAVLSVILLITGCQATGEEYQADVFSAGQVNTKQEAKTVKIISVTPAKVKVSNEANKKKAQFGLAALGALAGGAAGANSDKDDDNTKTAVGALAGGALGAAAGNAVSSETLVPGVLISYSEDDKIFTSAQVGQVCQFKPGEISLLVATSANATRIQPNATCPVEKGSA